MKRLLLVVGFVVTLSSWASAQDLTGEELARATAHLKKTSAVFLGSMMGLSEAQLKFKAGPTRWSVAEVAEHIASTEDFLRGMIVEKVMKGPARTEPVNLREIDDFITTTISDRTNKAQAPEPLAPTNRFGSAAESVKHFQESRAKTIAFLKDTKGLRDHAIDSPVGKKLDAYQWVLFISAHCERHTKQIEEVKAEPEFPKQ